jgi:hypothetical protein
MSRRVVERPRDEIADRCRRWWGSGGYLPVAGVVALAFSVGWATTPAHSAVRRARPRTWRNSVVNASLCLVMDWWTRPVMPGRLPGAVRNAGTNGAGRKNGTYSVDSRDGVGKVFAGADLYRPRRRMTTSAVCSEELLSAGCGARLLRLVRAGRDSFPQLHQARLPLLDRRQPVRRSQRDEKLREHTAYKKQGEQPERKLKHCAGGVHHS